MKEGGGEGRWRRGEEEEEVNILRGVEENQPTGSAAPVNTESLPALRAAHSLLESDVLGTRTARHRAICIIANMHGASRACMHLLSTCMTRL